MDSFVLVRRSIPTARTLGVLQIIEYLDNAGQGDVASYHSWDAYGAGGFNGHHPGIGAYSPPCPI